MEEIRTRFDKSSDNGISWSQNFRFASRPNIYFPDNISAADIISRHTSCLKGFIYLMSRQRQTEIFYLLFQYLHSHSSIFPKIYSIDFWHPSLAQIRPMAFIYNTYIYWGCSIRPYFHITINLIWAFCNFDQSQSEKVSSTSQSGIAFNTQLKPVALISPFIYTLKYFWI